MTEGQLCMMDKFGEEQEALTKKNVNRINDDMFMD